MKGNASAPLGLIFVSKWSSPKAAAQFAAIYARGVQQRYKKIDSVAETSLPTDLKNIGSLGGDHSWKTEDGVIVIDVKGDTVLVAESLDQVINDQIKHAIFGSVPR
jgi:hypothetical protein